MRRTEPEHDAARPPRSVTLSILAGVLILVAACSPSAGAQSGIASLTTPIPADGGEPGQPTPRASLSPADREQAFLDFAACMRDNGVDMADPQFDLDGRANMGTVFEGLDQNDPEVRAATETCTPLLPSQAATDPALQAERQDRLLEFAQCMRENDVEMADPVAGGGPGRGPMAGLDQNDPTVQAGLEACREFLGRQGGGE